MDRRGERRESEIQNDTRRRTGERQDQERRETEKDRRYTVRERIAGSTNEVLAGKRGPGCRKDVLQEREVTGKRGYRKERLQERSFAA